jgi:hypothetical protein
MITADPFRTPTYTLFADPDWFFFATSGGVCATPGACATIPARTSQSFAWNHGDIQDEIATTWVGYVGPGIRHLGTSDLWTDHTDVRPTMLTTLGLKDDYVHDGRAAVQLLYGWAVPPALNAHRETLLRLEDVYKQLNAPFGSFGMDTLTASTAALAGGSGGDDSMYTSIEGQLDTLTTSRNSLADQIKAALAGAEFGGQALNEQQAKSWIAQASDLLKQAHDLAIGS